MLLPGLFTKSAAVASTWRPGADPALCLLLHALSNMLEGVLFATGDLKFFSRQYPASSIAVFFLFAKQRASAAAPTLSDVWGSFVVYQVLRCAQCGLRVALNQRKPRAPKAPQQPEPTTTIGDEEPEHQQAAPRAVEPLPVVALAAAAAAAEANVPSEQQPVSVAAASMVAPTLCSEGCREGSRPCAHPSTQSRFNTHAHGALMAPSCGCFGGGGAAGAERNKKKEKRKEEFRCCTHCAWRNSSQTHFV